MRRKSYSEMNCSVARTLEVVGDPWTLLIVRDALWGYCRFNDFQERLGIPRNTLADRLASLVQAGVLDRVSYQSNPDRFEYVPTEKGLALRPIIITLMQWGDEWSGIEEPPVHLVDRQTDVRLDLVLTDRKSGRPLDEINVRAVGSPTE